MILWIEGIEDTKRVIRIRKSKDRQDNVQKEIDKRTNNDLQNTTKKTKDRATPTPLKTEGEVRCSGKTAHALLVAPDLNLTEFNTIMDGLTRCYLHSRVVQEHDMSL